MQTVCRWLIVLALAALSSPAHSQSANERDDSFKYACLVTAELGVEVDEAWCQCQNDYYNELLTDADWETYSQDYYALRERVNDQRSTPPNSYERYVKLGPAHCRTCKANDYRGCLSDDGRTPSTGAFARLLGDLRDGQFDAIDNTMLFKTFFVHYVNGYSAFCADRIDNYVDRTVVWQEWLVSEYSRIQTDEQVNVTRIAARLAPTYDQYQEQVSRRRVVELGNDYLEARRRQELPFELFGDAVKQIVEPVTFMREHLEGRCDTAEVAAAYENLFRFSQGLEPQLNPEFLEERRQEAAYRERRKAEVRAAVIASRDRAAARYAASQAREAQLPPKNFNCSAAYQSSRAGATVVDRYGSGFQSLVGGWTGTFNGKPVELAAWSDRTGRSVGGYAYFPDYDCLMNAKWETQRAAATRDTVAFLRLRVLPQNQRLNNCAAMVRDDRDGEIHFFGAQGFVTLGADNTDFVWTVSSGKLSQHSPIGCDDLAVTMQPGRVSDQFKSLLRQHPGDARYGTAVPSGFVDSLK